MAKNANAKKIEATEAQVEQTTEQKVEKKVELTAAQQKEFDGLKTKSAKIRFLAGLDYPTASIAKHMKIKYQHARNVLNTPLKRPA